MFNSYASLPENIFEWWNPPIDAPPSCLARDWATHSECRCRNRTGSPREPGSTGLWCVKWWLFTHGGCPKISGPPVIIHLSNDGSLLFLSRSDLFWRTQKWRAGNPHMKHGGWTCEDFQLVMGVPNDGGNNERFHENGWFLGVPSSTPVKSFRTPPCKNMWFSYEHSVFLGNNPGNV